PPCHAPIRLARVPAGIASQSMRPNGAAIKPLMMPAAIIQYAISDQYPCAVTRWMMSKITAIARSPNGNTMSIGWMGCPNSLTLLSIHLSCAVNVQATHRCHLSHASDSVRLEVPDGYTTQRDSHGAADRSRSDGDARRAG